ncbi:ORF_46 [Adoxophyes orana granulovirus]|uniref:ODV-EC43 n=1 Tax=Adoxophyes orana granulovirus TaxID=170617 RepID=Q7T9W9_GVAO|nr:ORF_46 [Adoxophyes orana granulovirus]AAP85683.1 ORF_46 [Adoxophyes orana granulovirus]AJA91686.1 ODV-EC43 [Adoxophyes orana granulovirus]
MTTCSNNIRVYVNDSFVYFPYERIKRNPNYYLTVFVPTYADEEVIDKSRFTGMFKIVNVIKYVSNFDESKYSSVSKNLVVYWNVIVPINILGVGTTDVYNVVLSDNLYKCNNIVIENTTFVNCPLQVDYDPSMICLKGELVGYSSEINKALNNANNKFIIHFDKDTPMGVKILNTKRYFILLSVYRSSPVKLCIYLTYDELNVVHKELSWESIRRQMRGGLASNACNILNRSSYKYVQDAMEILQINTTNISSIHVLVKMFTPLILRYKLVPDIFVEMNRINGNEKHVRLYCKHESLAITNAGPVPINLPTINQKPFTHNPLQPPSEELYRELGTRRAYINYPKYNYFL